MFDIQNYPGFVLAILVFQAVPGPGTVAILGTTAKGGACRLAERLAGAALICFGLKLAQGNR